jgi:hypothetical protein
MAESNMAKSKDHANGQLEESMNALARAQTHLVEAHASLAQTQATLSQTQATLISQFLEWRRENAERFERVERILLDHSRILAEHGRTLEALPDAVRERMGFRPVQSQA